MKILLDAGHFGKTNKYTGTNVYESEVMWKLHNYLKKELESYGVTVGVTRQKQEVDLPVADRGKMAKGYDLLISLHSNACDTESVNRAVVIPYQQLDWTDIDDKSLEVATVLGIAVRDTMKLSSYQIFQRRADNDRDGNGVKDDEYYGILNAARQVGTPALIVEHSFHTNKASAKWLANDVNLQKLAKAEADALADYYFLKKKSIKKGDIVSVAKGATYYGTNKKVPDWVLANQWVVSSVKDDRAVIDESVGGKYSICSAINTKYLTVIEPDVIYCVEVAFGVKRDAEELAKQLKTQGYTNACIVKK
mgnify:CR=1 FL=1